MDLRMGTDLVFLPKFEQALQLQESYFRQSVFFPEEWSQGERRAGIFAAKEACFKAFEMPGGDWLAVRVTHKQNGSPKIDLCTFARAGWQSVLSISHEGEYVIAVVLFWGASF